MTAVAMAEITPPAIMEIRGPYSSAIQPDKRRSERRAAQEYQHVQPHHAAAHGRGGTELRRGVRGGGEAEQRQPGGHEQGEEQPEVRHQPGGYLAAG